MHTDAQASGLPFPPLLRKELFDARGLPEWYCPTRGARPIAAWALVSGSAFALGALLLAICLVSHHRVHRLSGSFPVQVPICGHGAAECKAALRIAPSALLREDAVIDGHAGIAVSQGGGKALAVRIVGFSTAQNRDLTLFVMWPRAVSLPTQDVAVALGEARTLFGWLAPKRLGAPPARPQR